MMDSIWVWVTRSDQIELKNWYHTMVGLSLLACFTAGWAYSAAEQQKINQYLSQQFNGEVPKPARMWVKADMKPAIKAILQRPVKQLSYRYWQADDRTIWLLDELGKERDITTAVTVIDQQISAIKVVVYRESRGGEVQVPWFTDQFKGAQASQQWQRNIDGISGATLSVNALKKQAELALYLDQQLP